MRPVVIRHPFILEDRCIHRGLKDLSIFIIYRIALVLIVSSGMLIRIYLFSFLLIGETTLLFDTISIMK